MGISKRNVALKLTLSDAKLKKNIRHVGNFGPLPLYEWEWAPDLQALGIEIDFVVGFLADEVEILFPEFVYQVGPYKAVDYAGLLNNLNEVIH